MKNLLIEQFSPTSTSAEDKSVNTTNNNGNKQNTNTVQNNSSHVNPSENIKSSRDNLTNYNKDLNNVQEKRTKF